MKFFPGCSDAWGHLKKNLTLYNATHITDHKYLQQYILDEIKA
jgi:hypothetical protein